MTKLNQIIAVESGLKTKAERDLTELYKKVQKPALLTGISRTYVPKDDEGDRLPSESTLVQVKVDEVLTEVSNSLERLFDVTLTKEEANAQARADVKVDGKVILSSVPVTYLLFLEKKLVDLVTFVNKLPTLDPAFSWSKDANTGVYVNEATQTVRTKKVPRNHVKAEATDKHPAQVEVFFEDIIVGTWTKTDSSGAIPSTVKAELLSRVEKLQTAVKFAREEANSVEVQDAKAGAKVFKFLFEGVTK